MRSQYAFKPDQKPNILRTIYLPNYEVDSAKEEIEVLKNEIAVERKYYEDVLKRLQDDKIAFEEEQRVLYLDLQEKYQTVLEKLHQTEQYNNDIVKDHIELKHFYDLEERAKQEENEVINQENQMLRNAIRRLVADTNQTVNLAKKDYVQNSEEFSQKFREQNMQHAKNMHVIQEQYKKLSTSYKIKKEILSKKWEDYSKRLATAERNRKLDLEGSCSDLSNLKKRMVFYQNYIGKLKTLVDKEEENILSAKRKQLYQDMENDIILEDVMEEQQEE